MKKLTGIILGILVAASTALATKGDGEKAKYEIDTNASKVYWTGGKVTGSSHTGYLLISDGEVSVKNNKVVGALVNIDLNSIVCTDIEKEGSNQKLVGHLKSDDFFSVEKHPIAKFEITSSTNSGGKQEVVGNLTIKGITHEVSFPANVNVDGNVITANGKASIDRTKWDIKYGSGKFFSDLGDRMILDEFEIKFELTAKVESDLSAN